MAYLSWFDALEISIHALREEGDSFLTCKVYNMHKFLSTPSARRATRCWTSRKSSWAISIHALREEGDQGAWNRRECVLISIHALREEGD